MTRFIQYPFDKTKMEEVKAWAKTSGLAEMARGEPGIKDFEVSFCPGEGWLAARYIFNDLDDMVGFLGGSKIEEMKKVLASAPHQDTTRQAHEFKGFFLKDV